MIPVSIIIPVLHETHLDEFLKTLCVRFKHEHFEVIVVDGDRKGGSIARIKGSEAICIVSKKGRGPQMNAGARMARGEVLLFLHADTHLPDNAFKKIAVTLSTRRFDAGAFTLGFHTPKKIFSLIAWGAACRCLLTRLPYGDQAFFMRRPFFFRMGGFQEFMIMEDIDLMRRIGKRGGRVRILADRVLTSPRRWEREGLLFSILRTWTLSTLFLCGVDPKRLARYYRSELHQPK